MILDTERILREIVDLRVGVLGDFCLDAYWFLDPAAGEISVETGIRTTPAIAQRSSGGGAANVAANLAALGVRNLSAYGFVGDDPFGMYLRSLLDVQRIQTAGLIIHPRPWDTHVYIKPHVHEREESRIDFGTGNTIDDAVARKLLSAIERDLPDLDLLLINDQISNGLHSSGLFQTGLRTLVGRDPSICVLFDSRSRSDLYAGTIRKINSHEALRLCGMHLPNHDPGSEEEGGRAAETLYGLWHQPVFITRGAHGCLLRDAEGLHLVPAVRADGPIDTVGAGDSMLAGIGAALAVGQDAREAAAFGHLVAGVTIRKLRQTGTASPDEILALVRMMAGAEA
jgi:bifunctional ADP-heptose synthase (sugar kinase/adenylyltransferase)